MPQASAMLFKIKNCLNANDKILLSVLSKVRFAEDLVTLTVEDPPEFADELKAYRRSDVARMRADQQRFRDRIGRVDKQISHVFKTSHRDKVFQKMNNVDGS